MQQLTALVASMMLVAGCSIVNLPTSKDALCDGLNPLVDAHVDALLIDGGPRSLVTGDTLVAGYDAGCQNDL